MYLWKVRGDHGSEDFTREWLEIKTKKKKEVMMMMRRLISCSVTLCFFTLRFTALTSRWSCCTETPEAGQVNFSTGGEERHRSPSMFMDVMSTCALLT